MIRFHFLITHSGAHLSLLDTVKQFETEFFRIEDVDRERCRGTVSLLRAFDYEGNDTNSIADVVRLEKQVQRNLLNSVVYRPFSS